MTMGLKKLDADSSVWDLDFNVGNSLYNAIVISLYTNKRDESIEAPQNRGGWFGNLVLHTDGFEQGSLLWTLQKSVLNEDTAIIFQNNIEECLEWLLTDNIVSEVNVDFVKIIGNKTQIIEIEEIDYSSSTLQLQLGIVDLDGNNLDLKNLQTLSYNG